MHWGGDCFSLRVKHSCSVEPEFPIPAISPKSFAFLKQGKMSFTGELWNKNTSQTPSGQNLKVFHSNMHLSVWSVCVPAGFCMSNASLRCICKSWALVVFFLLAKIPWHWSNITFASHIQTKCFLSLKLCCIGLMLLLYHYLTSSWLENIFLMMEWLKWDLRRHIKDYMYRNI